MIYHTRCDQKNHDDGSVLVPGLMAKDDVLKTDGLKRAKTLGRSIS